jgi:hypothetical protein
VQAEARPDERSASMGFGSVGFFLSAVDDLPDPASPLPPPGRIRAPPTWPRSLSLADLRLGRLPVRTSAGGSGVRSDLACGPPGGTTVGFPGNFSAGLTAGFLPGNLPAGTVDWAGGIRRTWAVGEDGAHAALAAFVQSGAVLRFGSKQRFRADEPATAAISPHLRFGEITSRQVRLQH